MKLEKDRRWDAFLGIDEEYFNNLVDRLRIRPEAPEQIHRLIKQVLSILRFCYYDYELVGVTNLLSALAFETALRFKYQELNPNDKHSAQKKFEKLIAWGEKANLFEEHIDSIHALRKLRNYYAHPKDTMVIGIMGISSTMKTVDHINGIFDNRVDLRIERKRKVERINLISSNLSKNGMILHYRGLRLIIFDVRLLIYNNLSAGSRFYFWVYPIFEIIENATEVDEKQPIIISSNSLNFRKTKEGRKLVLDGAILTELNGQENRNRFEEWQERLKGCRMPIKFLIDQNYNDLRRKLMSEKIYRWMDRT